MTVYAYLRVSQGDQDTKNQEHAVLQYANTHGFVNVEMVHDVVTSRLNWRSRKIGELIDKLVEGDVLLCSEATRLGRSALEVLEIQKEVLERQAILHIIKEGLVVGNAGQTEIERILQKTMLSLLGSIGEMERAFISRRTKEALAKKKSEGMVLGRPKGVESVWELDTKVDQVVLYLKKGLSIPNILKLVAEDGKKPQTARMFYLWAKRWGIKNQKVEILPEEMKRDYFYSLDKAQEKVHSFLKQKGRVS